MKQGRNERCWCGSGLKYKHCHLKRKDESAPSLEEMLQVQRGLGKRKLCMHPEASPTVCSSTIVNAHTIQRSGPLAAIAENNEVMTFSADLVPMLKSGGIPVERLVRIRSASTFTGFCEKHDGPTFAPFETVPFTGTREQCFLMGYRALCRELYAKTDQVEFMPAVRELDRGLSEDEQFMFQAARSIHELMSRVGCNDLMREKSIYDAILLSRDFSSLEACILTLDRCPDVVTSSFLPPTKDFNDNVLQDLSEVTVPVHGVGFNLLSTESGGVAVFTWLKSAEHVGRKLVSSLQAIDINRQADAIIRFAFSQTDNSHFSKSWWNRRSEQEKEGIRRLIAQDIHPFGESTSLIDDGFRTAEFAVIQHQWIEAV